MQDYEKFIATNDFAVFNGFSAGLPNFQTTIHTIGAILLNQSQAELHELPASVLTGSYYSDIPQMFRIMNDYADTQGFPAAFPTCRPKYTVDGNIVYESVFIKPGVTVWRDVPRDELNVYHIEDVPNMMRAANRYAHQNGFAAGFPTFHQAIHGNVVMCGVILFLPNTIVTKTDIPVSLLNTYLALKKNNWAIILCHPSDLLPGINSKQRYIDFFTNAGAGTGTVYDYWNDVSYKLANINRSKVFGWYDVGHTTAELNSLMGHPQRYLANSMGIDVIQSNHVDITDFSHILFIYNLSIDSGAIAVGGNVIIGIDDNSQLEPTFIAHEMGHGFGLEDSFGEYSRLSGDGRYGDSYDIMSAMNVYSYLDNLGRLTGPALNAFNRERLGWLLPDRINNLGSSISAHTISLVPLNEQQISGFQMIKFRAQTREPNQTELSTYTLEFREPVGWDRGFGTPHILIHELRSDGILRLINRSFQGMLDLFPNAEFTTPDGLVIVRLVKMSSSDRTATIRIWKLPASSQRSLRIKDINFNPPLGDLPLEFVVIQNDTLNAIQMNNWTLSDLARHIFTFPSFILEPGFSIKIWTKSGVKDAENLFMGYNMPVWNNTGDTAFLKDPNGLEISRFSF